MRGCSGRVWPALGNGLLLSVHHHLPITTTSLCRNRQAFYLAFSPSSPESILVFQSLPQHRWMTLAYGDGLRPQPWQQAEAALCPWSYLGSDVVRSPAERGGRHTVQNPFLAHSEVGQLAMTFCIQKDVVQFQIPVRWARTTWLMLHSSQYDLSEVERYAHLREICYRKESLQRGLICQQPTPVQGSCPQWPTPQSAPHSLQPEGGASVTSGMSPHCFGLKKPAGTYGSLTAC